ncbi:MAG: hypothetical protein JSW71_12000 [Gemmatimonadota bacterium]|nr:MAG: hypothetical protein JSW71_12000 [Gemmatimonadota bacterium]
MDKLGAVVGGAVAGTIGALIWAGIAYFTGYELGWIAWAVGGMVGFGVLVGSARERTNSAGVIAVVVAMAALLGGKYMTVHLLLGDDSQITEAFVSGLQDDELVISYLADDVAAQFADEGKPVDWPVGVDPSQATTQVEYPPDVWAVAQGRWDAMSHTEREQFRAELETMVSANVTEAMEAIRGELTQVGFIGSFGALDLIFFGLAVVTAYKVAAGSAPERREEQAELAGATAPEARARGKVA